MKTNDRLEVLKLKLKGLSPEQIADKLGLRLGTVFKHDTEIKRQMAKENATDLADLSPDALESVTATVNQLLPYMERATSKIVKQSQGLKPLHTDTIENAELVQALIHKALRAALDDDEPDIAKIGRLNDILNSSYKAFFNKDGIQVVNVLNDSSNTVNVDARKENLRKSMKAELQQIRQDHIEAIDVEEEPSDETTTPAV